MHAVTQSPTPGTCVTDSPRKSQSLRVLSFEAASTVDSSPQWGERLSTVCAESRSCPAGEGGRGGAQRGLFWVFIGGVSGSLMQGGVEALRLAAESTLAGRTKHVKALCEQAGRRRAKRQAGRAPASSGSSARPTSASALPPARSCRMSQRHRLPSRCPARVGARGRRHARPRRAVSVTPQTQDACRHTRRATKEGVPRSRARKPAQQRRRSAPARPQPHPRPHP